MAEVVDRLAAVPGREGRLTHLELLPARPARTAPWPDWADPAVLAAYHARGVAEPWRHQAVAADAAYAGQHVVLATGTASGKSLAYQLPALTSALATRGSRGQRGATTLYLAPTKALAQDQLAGLIGARPRRPGHHPRRRQQPRPARVGARPRGVRPDQPRHAAPLAAARARALALLPLPAALRRGRRVPPLPRGLRGARRPGAAAAAPDLRGVRRAADVRARLGHRRRARGRGRPAHRPRRARRDRRLLAARRGVAGDVAAGAHPVHRRERRPPPARCVLRGRRPARRPRRRGRPHPGLHPVAPRRRAGRDHRRGAAGGGRPVAARRRSRPTAAATCPRSAASWSASSGPAS